MVFVGVDVGMSRERARASSCQIFSYKTNDEVDNEP